jgi:hypothetical protein
MRIDDGVTADQRMSDAMLTAATRAPMPRRQGSPRAIAHPSNQPRSPRAPAKHTQPDSLAEGDMNEFASPRAGRREWIGLAVLALPCLIYSMDLTVLNLAVPRLSAALITWQKNLAEVVGPGLPGGV